MAKILMDIINNELQKHNMWLRANKLTLNMDKTYYMIFPRARIKNKDFALGNSIKNVHSKICKYICIILDNKISWLEHITCVMNTILKAYVLCIKLESTTT